MTDEMPTEPESELVDVEEYENQEWTLGEHRTGEIEVHEVRFKVQEPRTDEEVERILMLSTNIRDNLREIVDALVVAPELTDDRWNNQMTPRERVLLAGRALDWFGFDDFMDDELTQQQVDEYLRQQQADRQQSGSGSDSGADGSPAAVRNLSPGEPPE